MQAANGVWRYWGRALLSASSATWQQLFVQVVFQFSYLLLSSTLVYQLGFSSGRTFSKTHQQHQALTVMHNMLWEVSNLKLYNYNKQHTIDN